MNSPYKARTSVATQDRAWDDFLSQHGGHYKQSSCWAQVKGAFNWDVVRVTVERDDEIVAGAQVLLRRLPLGGAIGLAPRAPVLAGSDREVLRLVLDELHQLRRRCRVWILMVHPPRQDPGMLAALESRGYSPTPLVVAASATTVIDLRNDEDAILSGMRKKTRQHVRKGIREGVEVHQGDEGEITTFYRLHAETGGRKGFSPYPERYFADVWRAFRPRGSARIFTATYQGEVVSGLFVIAFGDCVYTLAVGWSGRHANRMPNEVLYWEAIRWAKKNGYSWWDFSSIDPRAAAAIADGRPLPDELRKTTTFFKLGFGGELVAFPSTYDLVFNPLLRRAYRSIVPPLYRSARLRRDLYRLRWRWAPSLTPRQGRT
jgi:peptidoglycan pentaglycine glycine transferase (the first glycine)